MAWEISSDSGALQEPGRGSGARGGFNQPVTGRAGQEPWQAANASKPPLVLSSESRGRRQLCEHRELPTVARLWPGPAARESLQLGL